MPVYLSIPDMSKYSDIKFIKNNEIDIRKNLVVSNKTLTIIAPVCFDVELKETGAKQTFFKKTTVFNSQTGNLTFNNLSLFISEPDLETLMDSDIIPQAFLTKFVTVTNNSYETGNVTYVEIQIGITEFLLNDFSIGTNDAAFSEYYNISILQHAAKFYLNKFKSILPSTESTEKQVYYKFQTPKSTPKSECYLNIRFLNDWQADKLPSFESVSGNMSPDDLVLLSKILSVNEKTEINLDCLALQDLKTYIIILGEFIEHHKFDDLIARSIFSENILLETPILSVSHNNGKAQIYKFNQIGIINDINPDVSVTVVK
jgi:hypothetical protein